MSLLQDKVAIVTGGGTGIGKATALVFAQNGAKVVIGNRSEDKGQATADEITNAGGHAVFQRTDVTVENDNRALIQKAVETFGGLHIAFNNAGTDGEAGPFHQRTADHYDHIFDVNVKGVFFAMKHQIAYMLEHGGGSIINNSSIAGVIGFPGLALYDASKHAVMGLTRSAALEYAPKGIRINAVNPAAIQTDMIDRITGKDPDTVKQFESMHPIGRLGKPEEIAQAVVFLASDHASFITGQPLLVDGGFTAR